MFKCLDCGKEFNKELSLFAHKRIHSPKFLSTVCDITKKSLATKFKKFNIIKEEYLKSPKLCLQCHKIIPFEDRISNIFCNHSCSASFSNKNRDYTNYEYREREVNCSVCGSLLKIKISSSRDKCDKCLNIFNNKCKICGQYPCLNNDICSHSRIFKTLSKTVGLNISLIGNPKIIDEYIAALKVLKEEYEINELSVEDIKIKYGFSSNENCRTILRSIGVNRRNLSESTHLSFKNGKSIGCGGKKFKHGWHIDWSGNKHFYRSSYELDYYIKLDNQKIEYETETLRIKYFDSQENKYRIAIPDILLPNKREIIEIKSEWTLDRKNMADKFLAYRAAGYDGYILLDKEDILRL